MAGQIPVIGLTGGIGAGKSTVTLLLEELGAAVIDADKVGHQIYSPDLPAWRALRQDGTSDCPICNTPMRLDEGVGRCRCCGSELS